MLDILRRTVGAGPHFFRLISDNLRSITNNFDSSYYHDIIISEIDNLYNRISFPVDNVDEDRYHTCYNIMYVLYHSDAEKFLQYCKKIKEDCDHMSRHRIEVLVEEIVKK